jgi:kinesin family protein 3/17
MASKKAENVKVAVRCRPLVPKEVRDDRGNIVECDSKRGEVSIMNPKVDAMEPPKTFTFDYVYGQPAMQEEIYLESGYPIVESVLEGYNGTIFAYGQTGSGKTFTMEGKDGDDRGIIPRAFEQIFYGIELHPNLQFLIRVSYLEIYNEEIYDLLANNPHQNKLEMRQSAE